jgi:hypothetical protein
MIGAAPSQSGQPAPVPTPLTADGFARERLTPGLATWPPLAAPLSPPGPRGAVAAGQVLAPQIVAPQPGPWLSLDIETAAGRRESIEAWMRTTWSPDLRWKDETIGRRFREAHAKAQERAALLDGATIIVIAGRPSYGEPWAVHCCAEHAAKRLYQVGTAQGFRDEAWMLRAARSLIDATVGPETTIIGHNAAAFDLPLLRRAYVCHNLRPPMALLDAEQRVFDTMLEYGRRFSTKGRGVMISLHELLAEFGIASHKQVLGGADVPALYERGDHEQLCGYALLDASSTAQLFLRMTGQAPDLE